VNRIDRQTLAVFGIVLATVLLATSCAYKKSGERAVSDEQIGTDYAKLSGYMTSKNAFEEETPADIRHSVIIDDATLTAVGESQTCFDTTVRTGSRVDEPIQQLDPRCRVDGESTVDAIAQNETLRIIDYGYQGYENTIVAEGVAAGEYLGLQLSKPAKKTFRVIERKAQVCCPASPTTEVQLIMANKRMGVNNPYGVRFVWQMK
jgi:hypothetical protein